MAFVPPSPDSPPPPLPPDTPPHPPPPPPLPPQQLLQYLPPHQQHHHQQYLPPQQQHPPPNNPPPPPPPPLPPQQQQQYLPPQQHHHHHQQYLPPQQQHPPPYNPPYLFQLPYIPPQQQYIHYNRPLPRLGPPPRLAPLPPRLAPLPLPRLAPLPPLLALGPCYKIKPPLFPYNYPYKLTEDIEVRRPTDASLLYKLDYTQTHAAGSYLFVETLSKSLLKFRKPRLRNQFMVYMKNLFDEYNDKDKPDMFYQLVMDMFFVHGLWPQNTPGVPLVPYLPEDFPEMYDKLEKTRRHEYVEFMKSWVSIVQPMADGTHGFFAREFEDHGQYGLLQPLDLLDCSVRWHKEINITGKMSWIAQRYAKLVHHLQIDETEYRGLEVHLIQHELDKLQVPRRYITTHDNVDSEGSKYGNVSLVSEVMYELRLQN